MKKLLATSVLMATLSTPALADPTVGVGFNITFGGGTVNPGVGVRVFSDDEPDEMVGALGVDYMFRSRSVRGSLGAAYLWENGYVELNGGYDFGRQVFEFGASAGGVNTNEKSSKSSDDSDDDDDPTPESAPEDDIFTDNVQ